MDDPARRRSDLSRAIGRSVRPWLVRAALAAWGASLVTICAYLLGGHLLTLPTPSLDNPVLSAAIDARRDPGPPEWVALHILYGDCGCSRRVIRRLEARGPSGLADERVVLVEPKGDDVPRLEAAGWRVELHDREDLHREFAVVAAPLLVIASPEGELRYSGGYTSRKRGPEIEDLALIRAAREGESAQALPLFGCAVNTQLARQVDPLGLR